MLSPWQRAKRKKQMRKMRGRQLAQCARSWRLKKEATKPATAKSSTSSQEAAPTTSGGSKRQRMKKRSEIELLFDVDGAPSRYKYRKRPPVPEQEKKTILGQKIELGSKRTQVKRQRHWSETSISSADLETPPDSDAASAHANAARGQQGGGASAAEQYELPKAEAMTLDSIPEAEDSGAQSDNAPDLQSSPDSDPAVKMTTRGKKNRYWYLLVKPDRKGIMKSTLSMPDNASLKEYQQYRQAAYAKYTEKEEAKAGGGAGAIQRKSRPTTPVAAADSLGAGPITMEDVGFLTDVTGPPRDTTTGGEGGAIGTQDESSCSTQGRTDSLTSLPADSENSSEANTTEPKVPKLVLKLPKKVKKDKDKPHHHHHGKAQRPKTPKQYPTISPVEPPAGYASERSTPPLISKITLPPKSLSSKAVTEEKGAPNCKPSAQIARMLEKCKPCQVKLVDLIKFLKMTGNEHMIPAMPSDESFSAEDDESGTFSSGTTRGQSKSATTTPTKSKKATESDLAEPPILPPVASAPNITPPKTAFEKQFMSFIDEKRNLAPYLGSGKPAQQVQSARKSFADPAARAEAIKQDLQRKAEYYQAKLAAKEAASTAAANATDLSTTIDEMQPQDLTTKKVATPSPLRPVGQAPQQGPSPRAGAATTLAAATAPQAAALQQAIVTTQGIMLQASPNFRPILPKLLPNQTAMLLIPVGSTTAPYLAPIQMAPQASTVGQPKAPSSSAVAMETTASSAAPTGIDSQASSRSRSVSPLKNVILPKVRPSAQEQISPTKMATISAKALTEKVQQSSEISGATSLMKALVPPPAKPSNRTARKQMRLPAAQSQQKQQGQGQTTQAPLLVSPSVIQRYRCLCCTYTCASKTVMSEHIYNHTDIVPYSCGYCGSIFGTRSGVTVHTKRDHKNLPHKIVKNSKLVEEQYFCTIEQYEMLSKKGPVPLKTVEKMSVKNTVSSPKPGIPEIPREMLDNLHKSNQSLKLSSQDLSLHETTYQCKFCTFKTIDQKTIKIHVSHTHQKERRFVCPMCKVSFFKQLDSMKKHIQKWHPGANADNIQYEPGFYQRADSPVTMETTSAVVASASGGNKNKTTLPLHPQAAAASVQQYSGSSTKKIATARKSMTTAGGAKRKASDDLPPEAPPTKVASQTLKGAKGQHGLALSTATAGGASYLNILPKASSAMASGHNSTATVASMQQQQQGKGGHQQGQFILNVPYSAAKQGASAGRTAQFTEAASSALGSSMLKITNVVSLKDAQQMSVTDLSSTGRAAVQHKEPVKEQADSQTPEKQEQAGTRHSIDASTINDRNTSPEYMCKEISSTSTEEIESPPNEITTTTTATKTATSDKTSGALNLKRRDSSSKTLPSPTSTGSGAPKKKCFECKICRKVLTDFASATKHLSQNHYIEFDYKCPYCEYSCTNAQLTPLMAKHLQSSHADRPHNVHIGLVRQEAFFRMVQVDPAATATGAAKSPPKRFRHSHITPSAAQQMFGEKRRGSVTSYAAAVTQQSQAHQSLSKTSATASRPQHATEPALLELQQRAGHGTVIIQQDEPDVINVAGLAFESNDQPLDFSAKGRATTPAVTITTDDSQVLDLSRPSSARPPSSAPAIGAPIASPRPPPPLLPMGIADSSQMQQHQQQLPRSRDAPPLMRAPTSHDGSTTMPISGEGGSGAESGSTSTMVEFAPGVVMEEGTSSEDEDEMARECYGVFNLQPPAPLNIPQFYGGGGGVVHSPHSMAPPTLVTHATPPPPPNKIPHHMTLDQYRLAAVSHATSHASAAPQAHVHASPAPRFLLAGQGGAMPASMRQRNPPPNVVVGGPGLNFSGMPPQFSRLISCPYCAFKNSSYDVMHSHIMTHDTVHWTCPYCPMPQKMARSVVEKHIRSCHPGADLHFVPYGLHPQNV